MVASSLEFKFIYFEVSESLVVRFLRELGIKSKVSSAYRLVGAYLIILYFSRQIKASSIKKFYNL